MYYVVGIVTLKIVTLSLDPMLHVYLYIITISTDVFIALPFHYGGVPCHTCEYQSLFAQEELDVYG